MKKKISYVLLIGILCFSFLNNVFASEFVVSPVVDTTTVAKGNVASVKINLKASESINTCKFKFESDSNIEYDSMSSVNGWVLNESGIYGVLVTNSSDSNMQTNGQNIIELKYRINGDGKVVIKTVQCVATVSETSFTYEDIVVSFTAKDLSGDTSLNSLTVSGGALSPANITSGVTDYIINLNSPSFGLSMIASNPDYQDDIVVKDSLGNEIKDISKITYSDPSGQGMMRITITVNNTTTYKLLVMYQKKEYDNSLKKITIDGKELALEPGKYNYTYTVGKNVNSVKVNAVLADSENFKFGEKTNIPGDFSLSDGAYIYIVVEPKDTSSGAKSTTYIIEVKKEGTTGGSSSGGSGSSGGTGSSSGNSGTGNVGTNPTTGDIPMFFMAFILIVSLVGSVLLYQKNLQSYK